MQGSDLSTVLNSSPSKIRQIEQNKAKSLLDRPKRNSCQRARSTGAHQHVLKYESKERVLLDPLDTWLEHKSTSKLARHTDRANIQKSNFYYDYTSFFKGGYKNKLMPSLLTGKHKGT